MNITVKVATKVAEGTASHAISCLFEQSLKNLLFAYIYIIKEVANGPVGRQPIMLGNRSGYCKEMAQKSHVVKHIFSVYYGVD